MRIALTGANGQLGQALCHRLAPHHTLVPLNEGEFDLRSPATVEQIIATQPDLVLHPAAYTNVDGCARDPELAYRVNGLGTHYVATACQHLDVPLLYISTNEVFAGSASVPYMEYDQAAPINAYGQSKWAGEHAVRSLLRRFYIVRVAWLFGGERNFVRTMLRLCNTPPEGGLRVVEDEIGNPTYAPDASDAIARLIERERPVYGTYHFVNSGSCSRYTFAQAIAHQAGYAHVPITPIRLSDYQRDSTPPPFTPLANVAGAALGITLRPWQEALAVYLSHIQNE